MNKSGIRMKILKVFILFLVFAFNPAVLFASAEVFYDPNLGYRNNFGRSVDIDGDTAVVGAPDYDSGGNGPEVVYVYKYDGLGWNLDATLPSPNSAEIWFGYAVAVDSNVIAVGAYRYDTYRGAVYVYEYNGSQWTGPTTLLAEDGSTNEYFGISVDVQGNTIVVGAYWADNEKGAAYVFDKNGSAWEQVNKLTDPNGESSPDIPGHGDRFGSSVSIDGDRIVVGAENDDYNNIPGSYDDHMQGSACVFKKTGSSWSSVGSPIKLFDPNAVPHSYFGYSVSIDGDSIAIGAYGAGKVYIYDWNETDSNWVQAGSPLVDPTPSTSGWFGRSVSLDGNNLLVGTERDSVNGVATGSVYLCVRDSSSWSMQQYWSSDLVVNDYFGHAVSLDGNNIVIGAYKKDHFNPNVTDCGAVYFFRILAADINRDGRVDFKDFAILAGQWQLEKLSWDVGYRRADGIVNFQDWAVFLQGWQKTTGLGDLNAFEEQWLQRGAYSGDIAPYNGGDNVVDNLDLEELVNKWLE